MRFTLGNLILAIRKAHKLHTGGASSADTYASHACALFLGTQTSDEHGARIRARQLANRPW